MLSSVLCESWAVEVISAEVVEYSWVMGQCTYGLIFAFGDMRRGLVLDLYTEIDLCSCQY